MFFEVAAFSIRELTLFAVVGFLVLGLSDLIVDFIWFGLQLRRRLLGIRPATLDSLSPPAQPGRFAIFVPAWHEAGVIGPMLRHALVAYGRANVRIYVGCYANDPDTIAIVQAMAGDRLRLVINPRPGPTTKADNLNAIWRTMIADERREGFTFKAVVLHDAEDIVHSGELALFDALIERFDLVQLPVLPLVDRTSRFTAGSYLDEFAMSHGEEMVVRDAIGAGVPSAGVGCALSRAALALLAGPDRAPFDADSVCEDYEVGLRLHAIGRKGVFVRLPAGNGGAVVATRGHFPARWQDAVAQKSRWMAGIALSGWDRLGWSGGVAERWMRLRDRQALLAALLLLVAYAVMLAAPLLAFAADRLGHQIVLVTPALAMMMQVAAGLLAWRLLIVAGQKFWPKNSAAIRSFQGRCNGVEGGSQAGSWTRRATV